MPTYNSRDELEKVIAECLHASFLAFAQDLELRIVNVLRIQDAFPQGVSLAIGKGVAEAVVDMLLQEVFKSGVMHDTLQKLL